MRIHIADHEFTEVWDGVLYKKLSYYPQVTDWEIRTLIEFIEYEQSHGRTCEIECEDKELLQRILEAFRHKEQYLSEPRPALLTECTACPYRKGCVTEFVCHTTSPENAEKIFASGKLLSALRARGIPVAELMAEKRNAANDPADYFEYIMLAWGNCQAGDRLVMERKLGRFPDERDLGTDFTPGVRFYFRYDVLVNHPGRVFDGVLPMKIKDEIDLDAWVEAIIIPASLKNRLEGKIPGKLQDRVIYVEHTAEDIWDWSEKVYRLVEKNNEEY